MRTRFFYSLMVYSALICWPVVSKAQITGVADRATQIQWSQQYAQLGDLSDAFVRSQTLWSDGYYVYKLYVDESGKMKLESISMRQLPNGPRNRVLVRKNGQLTVKGGKATVNRELIGGWDLLVFRDKKQKTTDTFVRVKEETANYDKMLDHDLQVVYDGVYALYSVENPAENVPDNLTPLGTRLLLGPNLYGSLVEGGAFPGSYRAEGSSLILGNGARWDVTMREQGISVVAPNATVTDNPYLGSCFTLTKLCDGYPELDGLYGFASVVPLTRGMLERFPKNALRLMQWEMYARHGLPILDPAYQNYFNKQPWYKPTGSRTVDMSDMEIINFRLIQTVEFEK